jgi:hypothetical protein
MNTIFLTSLLGHVLATTASACFGANNPARAGSSIRSGR